MIFSHEKWIIMAGSRGRAVNGSESVSRPCVGDCLARDKEAKGAQLLGAESEWLGRILWTTRWVEAPQTIIIAQVAGFHYGVRAESTDSWFMHEMCQKNRFRLHLTLSWSHFRLARNVSNEMEIYQPASGWGRKQKGEDSARRSSIWNIDGQDWLKNAVDPTHSGRGRGEEIRFHEFPSISGFRDIKCWS